MTSHLTRRYTTAARHVRDQLEATAHTLDNAVTDCPREAAHNMLIAAELKRLARIILGDIGEEQTEIEAEPLEIPTTVPAEPIKVPA